MNRRAFLLGGAAVAAATAFPVVGTKNPASWVMSHGLATVSPFYTAVTNPYIGHAYDFKEKVITLFVGDLDTAWLFSAETPVRPT